MKIRMMWRIRADMGYQGYDIPDLVGKPWYQCYYTPDRELYLPFCGW
jgi:hypothetical protein